MTQKNGTIEFIKGDGAPLVYVKEIKKMFSFNKMSGKLFTHDPFVIKTLDRLGYKRGKVKIDGVAVLADKMTEDEKTRVQKNIDRKVEKISKEIPNVPKVDLKTEEVKENKVAEEAIEQKVSNDSVKEAEATEAVEEAKEQKKEAKKETKKDKKKKPSSKLKKEIGNS